MNDFKSAILDLKTPLICDGSMATSLYNKGFYVNRSFEELSLVEEEAVEQIHQGFLSAGANILGTNTFSATVPKLTQYGLQDKLKDIIFAATSICRKASDDNAYVVGVLGPLGVVLEPLGPTSYEEAKDFYKKNIQYFLEAEVDGFRLEAFHDLKELKAAIQACKELSGLPVMAHIAIQENMKTSYGASLAEFSKLCDDYDVDCIGVSGEVGPSGALTAVKKLKQITKRPISVLPNAGLPRYINDQYIYMCNPDYMGKYAKRLFQAGAHVVGGHSGVYEEHIKAVSNALQKEVHVEENIVEFINNKEELQQRESIKIPFEDRSLLAKKLSVGEKVISIEVLPPKGVDFTNFIEKIKILESSGIEFVNIPDGARAVARMSSLQLSSYIKSNFKIEPIPHFTSRDRNLIGIQSDLLGSYINGVRNVLLVTGDPPKLGNCPGATAVYDVDAIGLTHIVNQMNHGLDLGGSPFGDPTGFATGVALNPTAINQELEIKRFNYKLEAGAEYAITQPIYCANSYEKFMSQIKSKTCPIIVGIWPLVSLQNAEFLKHEVPGVEVPDWVLEEMEKVADDKEASILKGIEIAVSTMQKLKNNVAGFQVSAPFNKVDVALKSIRNCFN